MCKERQFSEDVLWQFMPFEDKGETRDIRSPNAGPDPNFEIKLHPGEKSQEMTQGFVSAIQVICLCFKPPALTGISLPSRIWGFQDSHHPLGYFMEQSQPSPRKILPADIRGWQAEQRGQGFKGPWRIDSFLPAR